MTSISSSKAQPKELPDKAEEDPRDFLYRLNPKIRKQLNGALDLQPNDKADVVHLKEKVRKLVESEEDKKQLLDYETLSEIHKYWPRIDKNYRLFFYQLIDECKSVRREAPRKNASLQDRLTRLKREQSNRDYRSMTSGLGVGIKSSSQEQDGTSTSPAYQDDLSVSAQFREMRPILISVLNSVLVIGGSFFFFYKAVEYSMPVSHIPTQVMVALFGALVVAIAEVYFILRLM